MLKQVPFKKEYILFFAAIVLFLISYKLAFKQTFEAWSVNRQLKDRLSQTANLSYQPDYLKRKNNNLDRVINLYKTDTIAFRTYSISNIAIIAAKENVKLSEVPAQDPSFNTDQFIIQKLDFEGDFFSLTKTLNQLQHAKNIGFIRSFSYKPTDNRLHKKDTQDLMLEAYFIIAK